MDFIINYELALRLLLSLSIGALIGLEREYRSKAAGLRTMIMICLGSTIFTEISITIDSDSADRIASTIVTGIGFIGAGVIFKDGLSISGLTTATTIWICAALGMAVGTGEYFVAIVGSVLVLLVLSGLERVQVIVEKIHQERIYRVTFVEHILYDDSIDNEIRKLKLNGRKRREIKENDQIISHYEIKGSHKMLEVFNTFLKKNKQVKSYEY